MVPEFQLGNGQLHFDGHVFDLSNIQFTHEDAFAEDDIRFRLRPMAPAEFEVTLHEGAWNNALNAVGRVVNDYTDTHDYRKDLEELVRVTQEQARYGVRAIPVDELYNNNARLYPYGDLFAPLKSIDEELPNKENCELDNFLNEFAVREVVE